jgi:hypothetical protein
MQERCGSRPSASLKEWRKVLNDLVAGEREAILELIDRSTCLRVICHSLAVSVDQLIGKRD